MRMCGRYTLIHPQKISERFDTTNNIALEPYYNVTPGFSMPVIINSTENKKAIEMMKWGLIPHWAKDTRIGYKLINARAESVNKLAAFKLAFKNKRCLIPTTGFFEWQHLDKTKVPFYFKLSTSELFSFAGLYDIWVDAEGKEIKSYVIITTEPNEVVKPIHNRMPAILSQNSENIWLNETTKEKELLQLLKPYLTLDSFSAIVPSNNNLPSTTLALFA
jgi:putative SOS response-associated peptidase YedK